VRYDGVKAAAAIVQSRTKVPALQESLAQVFDLPSALQRS